MSRYADSDLDESQDFDDAEYTPRHGAAKNRANRIWVIVLAVIFFGSAAGLVWWWYDNRPYGMDSDAPIWTPGEALPTVVPSTANESPIPAWCVTTGNEFVPTKFSFQSHDVNLDVISVGWENGAAAAPPADRGMTWAWFNEGPKPGSSQGKVLLSGHTWLNNNKSIGNQLNYGLLTPGDYMVIADDSGNSACYQYTDAIRVFVADYNPETTSQVIYDNEGAPQLAMVVCSNWDHTLQQHMSRAIYYANLVITDPDSQPEPSQVSADPAAG
jgi:hypothetical protein